MEDTLAWPLPGAQAREILQVAQTVSDGCRVPPRLLTWGNSKAWEGALSGLVSEALKELGVPTTTKVTLTGLEVKTAKVTPTEVKQGGGGSACPAGEGSAGAWGSLVIELPALREGGALSVSHGGETKCFDFSGAAAALTCHWSACYGVCERQLQPLKSGRLFCLTYALSCTDGARLLPPSQAAASRRFEQLERQWVDNVR